MELKKSLASGISNDRLDDIYKKALEKGATGGKLLGAGGSGFFYFMFLDKIINNLKNLVKTIRF